MSQGPSTASCHPQGHQKTGMGVCKRRQAAAMPLFDALSALIWPTTCPVCGTAERWCDACQPGAPPLLIAQDRSLVVCVDGYQGPLGAVVRAWKLGGRRDLTELLAGHLARAVQDALGPDGGVLVPVPGRPGSRRRRGSDLVADLTRAAARQSGWECQSLLRWRRRVGEQVGRDATERRRNVSGSLRAVRRLSGPVVVVDDVRTTGATLGAAISALEESGAQPVAAAVLVAAGHSATGAHTASAAG